MIDFKKARKEDNEFLIKQLNETHKDLKFIEQEMEFVLSLIGFVKVKVEGEIGDVTHILNMREKNDEERYDE